MRPKPRSAIGPEHRLRGVDHPHQIHVEHAPEELRVGLREGRRLRRRRHWRSRRSIGPRSSAAMSAAILTRPRPSRRPPRSRAPRPPRRRRRARLRRARPPSPSRRRRTSAAATARPMPRLPPVTSACRSRSEPIRVPPQPPTLQMLLVLASPPSDSRAKPKSPHAEVRSPKGWASKHAPPVGRCLEGASFEARCARTSG